MKIYEIIQSVSEVASKEPRRTIVLTAHILLVIARDGLNFEEAGLGVDAGGGTLFEQRLVKDLITRVVLVWYVAFTEGRALFRHDDCSRECGFEKLGL